MKGNRFVLMILSLIVSITFCSLVLSCDTENPEDPEVVIGYDDDFGGEESGPTTDPDPTPNPTTDPTPGQSSEDGPVITSFKIYASGLLGDFDGYGKIDNDAKTITFDVITEDEAEYKKVRILECAREPSDAELYINGTKIGKIGVLGDRADFSGNPTIEVKSGDASTVYRAIFNVNTDGISTYTITYDANNDEYTGNVAKVPVPDAETITVGENYGFYFEGDKYDLAFDTSKSLYYAFKGWNTKPDGSGKEFIARDSQSDQLIKYTKTDFEELDSNFTLYAQWEGRDVGYTITTVFWNVPGVKSEKGLTDLSGIKVSFLRNVKFILTEVEEILEYNARDPGKSVYLKAGTTPTLEELIEKWGTRGIDYHEMKLDKTYADNDSDYIMQVNLSEYADRIIQPGTETFITYTDENGEQKTLTTDNIPKVTGDGNAGFTLWVVGDKSDFDATTNTLIISTLGSDEQTTYTVSLAE